MNEGFADTGEGMERTGGCLCGAVRFAAHGVPGFPHTCSCAQCRRHSGALTVAWVEYPAEAVVWTGPAGAPARWRSSAGSSRGFCPTCGSTLGALDDAAVVALVVGAFDVPDDPALWPESHSFAASRPGWWSVSCEGVLPTD